MTIPPISEMETAAKKLVWSALKNGNLREFTPRIIRQSIEKEFSLEEGTLDAPEYKSALKVATKAALDGTPPPEGHVVKDLSEFAAKSKRKSEGATKVEVVKEDTKATPKRPASKAKGKAKATVENGEEPEGKTPPRKRRKTTAKTKTVVSDEEEEDEDKSNSAKKKQRNNKGKKMVSEDEGNYEEESASPKKKPKATKVNPVLATAEKKDGIPEPISAPKSKPRQSRKEAKEYKSLEHVPTSDVEMHEPEPVAGPSTDTKKSPTRPKSGQISKPDTTPGKPTTPKVAKTLLVSEDVETEDPAAKSESELSVLIDEPPKRKRKSVSSEKAPKKAPKLKESKKPAKSAASLTKDEEIIKRLKALVVACGTRRVWSKVFEGIDSSQQQIKILKEILAELGMTGRLSMEQAKDIKAKRELAQELEDVKEFAQKVVGRGSRSQTEAKKDVEVESALDSEDDDDDDVAPTRRPNTARKSIMAFLEDQSDDE